MEYSKDFLDHALSMYVHSHDDQNPATDDIKVQQVLAIRRYIAELEEKAWMYDDLCK